MPIICLDCGNTRLKWGVWKNDQWQEQSAVSYHQEDQIIDFVAAWQPRRVMLAEVAAREKTHRLMELLSPWGNVLHKVKSTANACGVRNFYHAPERLGADRWCALLGARALFPTGSLLVVMAGTATTLDQLDANGDFQGGVILPGFGLMRRALAKNTAKLPFARGDYRLNPRNTDDAIISGCTEAQIGAIERVCLRQKPDNLIISGGNALAFSRHLTLPHHLVNNLPLEGLRCLATKSPEK